MTLIATTFPLQIFLPLLAVGLETGLSLPQSDKSMTNRHFFVHWFEVNGDWLVIVLQLNHLKSIYVLNKCLVYLASSAHIDVNTLNACFGMMVV